MLVHRFDRSGRHLGILDGTTGAGRFDTPHAVHIDRRHATAELHIADRGNRRIQVYDLNGQFLRTYGEEFLLSPSGFAAYGEELLITELDARIAVLGPDDTLRTYIGDPDDPGRSRPGWPNVMRHQGLGRPELRPGRFNSPHGIAVDSNRNVYVSEWVIGGRLDRLVPIPA